VSAHSLITSFVGDGDAEGKRALGRLGGLLFISSAVTLVASLPLLDDHLRPDVPTLFAGICVVTGLVMYRLPWHRWPRGLLASQSVLALVLFTVAARMLPEAYAHYLPLYFAIFLYVGITQRLRGVLVVSVLMVASWFVATTGVDSSAEPFAFALILGLGLASAIAQSVMTERYRSASENIDLILQTTRKLGSSGGVHATLAVLERTATTLLDADVVVAFLAEHPDSLRYVATTTAEDVPPLVIDICARESATVARLAAGESAFVADATDPRAAPDRLAHHVGVRSALYLPFTGEDNRLGALVIGWRAPRSTVDQLGLRTMGILVNEAGRVLARQREDARVRREAQTDPLTGLCNRRAFDERLRHLDYDDTVMLIDLDHFKAVNDRHGHPGGDRALRALAACMRDAAGTEDCTARIGGDELAMVLRGGGRRGGLHAAEQLRDLWARTDPVTTLSIGIAVHLPGESPSATVSRADTALYEAKRTGRDCFVIHDRRVAVREPG
jgi:diguanylate cyclase (GGDEF)-like protein